MNTLLLLTMTLPPDRVYNEGDLIGWPTYDIALGWREFYAGRYGEVQGPVDAPEGVYFGWIPGHIDYIESQRLLYPWEARWTRRLRYAKWAKDFWDTLEDARIHQRNMHANDGDDATSVYWRERYRGLMEDKIKRLHELLGDEAFNLKYIPPPWLD